MKEYIFNTILMLYSPKAISKCNRTANSPALPASHPNSPLLWPHGHVIVEVVWQVIWNQIFARNPEIHRIPKFKLLLQLIQLFFWNVSFRERSCLEEDVIPNLFAHLMWPAQNQSHMAQSAKASHIHSTFYKAAQTCCSFLTAQSLWSANMDRVPRPFAWVQVTESKVRNKFRTAQAMPCLRFPNKTYRLP